MLFRSCGGNDTTSSAPTPEASSSSPTPVAASPTSSASDLDAAKAVAQEEADRYASDDYAGAWDLWTKEGQAAISRDDYVKFHEECPGAGVPYKVAAIRSDGDNAAVVRLTVGGSSIAFSYRLLFEDGSWRWQPSDSDLADYAKGMDGLIAAAKSEGAC